MKKTIFATTVLAAAMTAASIAPAAFTLPIPAAAIISVTSQASTLPDDIALDATNRIVFADRATAANEMILRFNSDGTGGTLLTNATNMIAAVELVNGTSTQTAITIRGLDVAADGDIIILGDNSAAQTGVLLSIDPTTAVVTVLCCSVNGSVSEVEGSGVLRVLGNTAYVGYNGAFGGPLGDAIVSFDTNATIGLPNLPATLVTSQAALEAVVTGLSATGALNLGPMTSDAMGNLVVADSNGAGVTDDLIKITLPGGTASLLVDNTDTIADISGATDLGYGGLATDGAGNIYASNGFGAGTGLRGIIQLSSAAAGAATTTLFDQTTILTDLGGSTNPGLGRAVYDAAGSRILFANSSGDKIGIVAMSLTSDVQPWTMYN